MDSVTIRDKDDIVMRLLHYFITEQNYSPIVVRGSSNEIWLENNEGPYRIIRINTNYIHNDEQLKVDVYKTKSVMKQIKRKTLSLKMNALNILLDLNEDVKIKDVKDIDFIKIKNVDDISQNEMISIFPNIKEKIIDSDNNLDLIINITNDINRKTEEENRIYEDTFTPKKPIFTNLLIGICVVMFIVLLLCGGNPLGISANILLYFGGVLKSEVVSGRLYCLITGAFLHASLYHIAFNMYALYIIGNQLESYLGKFKFLAVYLISAISASLMSCIFNSNVVSVGASGAIFGLLGSLLYFGYHYRLYLGSVLRTQIIPLIIINLIIGFTFTSIDNFANIGGLIGGYLTTMALGIKGKSSKSEIINGTITLIIYILFMAYIVFR